MLAFEAASRQAFVAGQASLAPRPGLQSRSLPARSSGAQTVAWCRDQGVDAATAAALASAVQTHRAELLRAAGRRASTIASGVLEDFDWSLRLVLASSTRAEMTEPVVVLTLTVRAGADDSPAEHIVELSRSDLEALVSDFDAIDRVLAKFAPITAAKA